MTKLVAIHYLHLAGAMKGTVEVIEPGLVFTAREDELGLTEGGIHAAARAYDPELDKGRKVFARAGAAASAASAAPTDISKMKKAELIALAKAEEIEIDESATVAVILAAIEAGRLAKDEEAI